MMYKTFETHVTVYNNRNRCNPNAESKKYCRRGCLLPIASDAVNVFKICKVSCLTWTHVRSASCQYLDTTNVAK